MRASQLVFGWVIAIVFIATGCADERDLDSHACSECLECEVCIETGNGVTCEAESHSYKHCSDETGNVHWFDSCYEQEEVADDCSGDHELCADISETDAECECTTNWEGEECETCPENWDPEQDCNVCLNHWVDEDNDCGTCPLNWDAEAGCNECIGNWDPASDCTNCLYQWIDESNDCGTCPGNWDPVQDCNECRNNWEGENCETCPGNWDAKQDCGACQTNWEGDDCEICPGNWDETDNCASCQNQWIDEGNDCGTCPGNWDPITNCSACQTNWEGPDCETCPENWDPTDNCDSCQNQWIDEGNDCGTCPGNWDAASDCSLCLGNWDEAANCESCANQWVDNGDDCGICPGNWDASTDCSGCLGNWDIATNCEQCLNEWVDNDDDCGTCPDGWSGDECNICVRFVNGDNSPGGTGLNWSDAFENIQPGIDSAYSAASEPSGPSVCEVWIVGSTDYFIYETSSSNTIQLRSNVHVYGGFVGTETSRDQRDWIANPTTINGTAESNNTLHVYHVLIGSDDAVIDGFRIKGGEAMGTEDEEENGGGLYIYETSPLIRNCHFTDNSAKYRGGTVYNYHGNPVFENCIFENSTATIQGGAVYNRTSDALFSNCIFQNNECTGNGDGGGAFNHFSSNPTYINCTFRNNTAQEGGGMDGYWADPIITNSIFWNNNSTSSIIEDIDCDTTDIITITWSNIQDGYEGEGNISVDPNFASTGLPYLQAGSPCIDAANGDAAPEFDILGNSRIDDPSTTNTGTGDPVYVDMGAYEFQP